MRISTHPHSTRGWLTALALLSLALGCDGGDGTDDAGVEVARTFPRFEPNAGPMDFGAIPFPDDLYLDDEGHPSLGELPSEAAALEGFSDATREMLAELDGFSALAPIFFQLPPGSVDPTSLPATPADSMREDASAFLLDASPGSAAAFAPVPVIVRFDADSGLLAMRPYEGHPLVPGRRYAAVLTTAIVDDAGMPIGPNPRFQAIRDASTRPEDPVDAEAHDHYTTILASIGSSGILPESIAALAVFTVQTVAPELAAARSTVWAGEVPTVELIAAYPAGVELDALLGTPVAQEPGLDVEGGVMHRRIGHLIQGRFEAPWMLGTEPRVHGRFRSDGADGLVVGRTEAVPFTLTVPTGTIDRLPVVIFQHGIGSERSSMLAVADALAGAGYATLAIDIPYHGMRAAGALVDARHRFGATEGPDDFGERTGQEIQLEYLGVIDEAGELPAFHPVYVRDAVRQSVADLMRAVRVLREGDWSAVQAETGLETLGFSADPLGYVGVSLGGIVGTVFLAAEPEVGAAVLNVSGGDWIRLVEHSAAFSGTFLPLLLPRLGVDASAVHPQDNPLVFLPEVALVSTLLDRGDAIAASPLLDMRPIHLLFQMAEHDETVGNISTESLARANSASIIDAEPAHTDLMQADLPVTENVELAEMRVTRGLTVFSPATHGLLSRRRDDRSHAQPVEPPFASVSPVDVDNPVDEALAQVVFFFESWRSGPARIEAPAP